MGYQNFATHFLDESLSQDVAHIDDLPLLVPHTFWMKVYLKMWHISMIFLSWNAQVVLVILSSCVIFQLFLSHTNNTSFFFFLVSFGGLMGKLCRYVGTLWVQDHGNPFRAP
jgi:hypothetical protein